MMIMERGAILRILENRLLRRYLRGSGIEIGALWRRFPVSSRARAWYVDRMTRRELEEHYPELKGRILEPNLVADATQLPVPPGSLNFLIASHVLEHLPFPLAALRAWYEALAPNGALLLKVPDKRYTFDAKRSRTPLARLIVEYGCPDALNLRAHYSDWSENVGGMSPGSTEFEQDVEALMRQKYSIHFNVWTDDDVWEMIDFTRNRWGLRWHPAVFWRSRFYRKEVTAVLLRQ
jgi:SAM-dependent methyltransferase